MQLATVTQALRLHEDSPRWTPGRILMWSLCLTPSAWFAAFGAFVLRARLAVGYWPFYGHPDPKDLAFLPHHYATILLFVASFAAPFGIAALLLTRRWLHLHGARLPIIFFLLTFLAMFLFLRTVGAPLAEWWMD